MLSQAKTPKTAPGNLGKRRLAHRIEAKTHVIPFVHKLPKEGQSHSRNLLEFLYETHVFPPDQFHRNGGAAKYGGRKNNR